MWLYPPSSRRSRFIDFTVCSCARIDILYSLSIFSYDQTTFVGRNGDIVCVFGSIFISSSSEFNSRRSETSQLLWYSFWKNLTKILFQKCGVWNTLLSLLWPPTNCWGFANANLGLHGLRDYQIHHGYFRDLQIHLGYFRDYQIHLGHLRGSSHQHCYIQLHIGYWIQAHFLCLHDHEIYLKIIQIIEAKDLIVVILYHFNVIKQNIWYSKLFKSNLVFFD